MPPTKGWLDVSNDKFRTFSKNPGYPVKIKKVKEKENFPYGHPINHSSTHMANIVAVVLNHDSDP